MPFLNQTVGMQQFNTSLQNLRGHFDFIIDTVSADHDLNEFLRLLDRDGSLIIVGAPPAPMQVKVFSLIGKK